MGSTTHKSQKQDQFSFGYIKFEVFGQPGSNVLYTVRHKDLLIRGEIWTEVMDLGVTIRIRVCKCIWKFFTSSVQLHVVSGMSSPETAYGRKAGPEGICTEYKL